MTTTPSEPLHSEYGQGWRNDEQIVQVPSGPVPKGSVVMALHLDPGEHVLSEWHGLFFAVGRRGDGWAGRCCEVGHPDEHAAVLCWGVEGERAGLLQ